MIVLAVDTSSAQASIALRDGLRPLAELRCGQEALHSTKVLPRIEFLLRDLGLAAEQLDGLAAVSGPGSFTGLRIGLGTIQGLALGLGRPCLGVSALDLMARRVRAAGAASIVTLRDAWRGELYAGFYDADARPLGEPRLLTAAALHGLVPAGAVVTGDGLEHARAALAEVAGVRLVSRSPFLAATLAEVAVEAFAAGQGGTPSQLRALYVRPAAVQA